ncbi:MAG: peptidase dimerization domain-containing protein [Candidatus Syntropharchaeia archaeon]
MEKMSAIILKLSEIELKTRIFPDPEKAAEELGVDKQVIEDIERVTFSVGKIAGGVKVNVIPDSCEAVIDCRIPPGITVGEIKNQMNFDCDLEIISGRKSCGMGFDEVPSERDKILLEAIRSS